MPETLIFGGTTEGREAALQYPGALVCVTSEYARSLLPPNVPCHVGALDEQAMEAFLREQKPRRVVDATHPYAVLATKTIRACCQRLGVEYVRVQRPLSPGAWRQYAHAVPDAPAAARALKSLPGPVLLTTGSHTLHVYTQAVDPSRLFARVLPTCEALGLCQEAGIMPSHIIAMQGPFPAALNAALYDSLGIRALVTKDSGDAGGVREKVIPALERNIEVVLIERPKEDLCAENHS